MARRGKCRCGQMLEFHKTPQGYKGRCPRCKAVVRLHGKGKGGAVPLPEPAAPPPLPGAAPTLPAEWPPLPSDFPTLADPTAQPDPGVPFIEVEAVPPPLPEATASAAQPIWRKWWFWVAWAALLLLVVVLSAVFFNSD